MVQDGRSISSGADSDDSSGPDSPQPPSGSATSHLIMEPEGLLGLSPPSSTTSSMPQRHLQPPELNGAGTGGGSSGCGGGGGGCPSTSGGTSSNTNINSNNNINNGKLIKSATANAAPTMIATSATVASPLGAGVSGGGPGTAVSATAAAAGGPGGGGGGGGGSSNVNSVLYPAAALANLPHDVLLSLMQSGHLQLHSNEGGFLWVSEQTEMGGKLMEREGTLLPFCRRLGNGFACKESRTFYCIPSEVTLF